jgi:hypothetical protein
MSALSTLSTAIGRGLLAGLAGTAAMTVSSSTEARLRRRAASTAPARATAKMLGIKEFDSDLAAARWNDLSHWGYGTSWGVVRGLLDVAGLSPRAATAAHGAAIYGAAQVTLPALEIAPPAVFWGAKEIAIDAFHHTVYAAATGVAYELIGNGRA